MLAGALVLVLVLALLPGGVASAQRPVQAEDESAALVAEGRKELRRGKLDAAARALDQAIALNPRRVDAYVLRSGVHAARKQYRQGIAVMRRAQALAPDDEEVLTALGSQLVLSGDAAAGVPMLQRVVAQNPRRYEAQVLLGHHWARAEQWPAAVAALEAYFAARPRELAREDARHRIALADAYLRAGRPAQALPLFQRAAAEQPGAVPSAVAARLGAAWAIAAIDCRRARPLLRELEPLAAAHPEIWLVDGRCALALGDPGAAIALGLRYLGRGGVSRAPAHALLGEAQAARGNLGEARKELEAARRLEPARRRWTVRLAAVLRRGGEPGGGLAALEQLGPPARPAADPDWWAELGEALLAKGDPRAAVARLTPIAAELPGHAPIRGALGAALLAAGELELATAMLDEAERIASTPRTRRLLGQALATAGAAKLAVGDAAAAEPLLARAEPLDAAPAAWRNLGIARLELGRPADAAPVLERAMRADRAPITAMLAARARALAGGAAIARPIYEQALAGAAREVGSEVAIEVAIDWAASELGPGGDPAIAVAALEKVRAAAAGPRLVERHRAALATARHAAGLAALRAGQGARAVELLRAVEAAPAHATRCDLALAAVIAGDLGAARAALRAVRGQPCPYPPPADAQAAPILLALIEGLAPKRAARVLPKLTALAGKATGPAAALRDMALRVVAAEAARAAYEAGAVAQARRHLQVARGTRGGAGVDEIALDLAVLELEDDRVDAALAALEKLAPRLPEALVHIGIAHEKQREPQKALDAWRRARKAGVRFAPLAGWIQAKERIYGAAP